MENIEIKVLNSQELQTFIELIAVFEEVFEIEDFHCPAPEYLEKVLQNEKFIVIIARNEGKIIAGATFHVLEQYYSTKPLAYLYDLAVLEKFQRKGVGKKIIAFAQTYFQERNFEEIFVQAELIDSHAIDFYRTTQPSGEEKVRHFYYKLE